MTPPLDSYSPLPADKTSLTDDERIQDVVPLPPPEHLIRFFPIQGTPVETRITETRRQVRQILQGRSDRLLVVMGPCSIHDPVAAIAYAEKLAAARERAERELGKRAQLQAGALSYDLDGLRALVETPSDS